MSSATVRLPLSEARMLADRIANILAPSCLRIEIAGSIRRQKPDCGDIDLVCLPVIESRSIDLFGGEFVQEDQLAVLTYRLVADGLLSKRIDINGRTSWGPRLKRAIYQGMAVDIQTATADTFGFWLLIRTGPASFNRRIVTPRSKGGTLLPGLEVRDGFKLFRAGGQIETPEEADVFDGLGLPYVAPECRA